MNHEIVQRAEDRMKKSLESLKTDLLTIRTGKATPALLDSVRVEAYGSVMPLSQVASITAPQPRLLVIQPWDKKVMSAIVRAIQKADLGVNPAEDGELIRLPIPALTEERRHDLVKRAKKTGEEARVAIRGIRREANDELKKAEKDHAVSEDEAERLRTEVQKVTDKHGVFVDEILARKEKEILEV
jgi:ribosome recycling factor